MNRRNFLKTSALATLASTSGAGTALAGEQTVKVELGQISTTLPVLQNLTSSGVSVFWTVSRPATGWIEFGETPELGYVANGAVDGLLPYDPEVLRIRISGLESGRRYYYRVVTAPVDFHSAYDIQRLATSSSEVYSFRTLNPSAESTSFSVWNDTHEKAEILQKLNEHLQKAPAELHFWNGDLFNYVQSRESMVGQVLAPVPTGFAMERPFFLIRGNHDSRGAAARCLSRVVETPGNKPYYVVRQGPLAALVLDTGEDKADSHKEYGGLAAFSGYRSEQQRWLEKAVEEPDFKSAAFRVLFTHIPLRGNHCCADGVAKWQGLLSKAKIDLAISGHTHKFAYHEPTQEQPFPLLVGGGPLMRNATFIHAKVTNETLKVFALSINGDELGKWEWTKK